MLQKNPTTELSAPTPTCKKTVTVQEAFAGLKNVIPNSNQEETEYSNSSSMFEKLMRDDNFWRRTNPQPDKVTYQMPMKHRACTLKRFELLNPRF